MTALTSYNVLHSFAQPTSPSHTTDRVSAEATIKIGLRLLHSALLCNCVLPLRSPASGKIHPLSVSDGYRRRGEI